MERVERVHVVRALHRYAHHRHNTTPTIPPLALTKRAAWWFNLAIGHGTLLGLYARAWQLRGEPIEGPLAWWDALYIDRAPLFPSFDRIFGYGA
jgi:hypothetical protein